ncbi:MAG: hypothetical protein M1840_007795 [Geoglossum simile]|nr:MAG: hypothetical protein M1840_007795 [Geoglossum simile]
MSTLDDDIRLLSPVGSEESKLKLDIITRLWDQRLDLSQLEEAHHFRAYFSYYQRQSHPTASSFTHCRILEIVDLLKDSSLDRQTIKSRFRRSHVQDSDLDNGMIDDLIDAAVRLWLMIYTTGSGSPRLPSLSGVWHFEWEDSKRLKELVEQKVFPKQNFDGNKRLPTRFDIFHLEKIAGIKVFWTNCLADHLSMTHNDSRVVLFHHATLLQHMKARDILPPDLLTETLKTLMILLPSTDENIREWFDKQREEVKETECPVLDPLVIGISQTGVTTRKLNQFVFWGERLEYLVQVYNEHEPKTLVQWVRDDRKPAQSWTFWIAAFAFLIATLSLIVAVLQTWASVASYRLAKAQAKVSAAFTSST